eukprot:m.205667 g.205667  ORF g.205667 m.205667 type:complete len:338 (+) comp25327_c2_seq1:250-1263(+)
MNPSPLRTKVLVPDLSSQVFIGTGFASGARDLLRCARHCCNHLCYRLRDYPAHVGVPSPADLGAGSHQPARFGLVPQQVDLADGVCVVHHRHLGAWAGVPRSARQARGVVGALRCHRSGPCAAHDSVWPKTAADPHSHGRCASRRGGQRLVLRSAQDAAPRCEHARPCCWLDTRDLAVLCAQSLLPAVQRRAGDAVGEPVVGSHICGGRHWRLLGAPVWARGAGPICGGTPPQYGDAPSVSTGAGGGRARGNAKVDSVLPHRQGLGGVDVWAGGTGVVAWWIRTDWTLLAAWCGAAGSFAHTMGADDRAQTRCIALPTVCVPSLRPRAALCCRVIHS